MKNEYIELLEEFSSRAYLAFNQVVPTSEWGNFKTAEEYLNKYWLSNDEYERIWQPIQNKIFTNYDNGLSGLLVSEQFEILVLRGGNLFLKEDYNQLSNCILSGNDKYFVIIENTFGGKLDTVPFRMKYPAKTTWEELISGNFISSALVDNSMKEYFVFSESGNWGKYSANDYDYPVDIMGFKQELACVFRKQFKQTKDEKDEIKEYLPPIYKKLIK